MKRPGPLNGSETWVRVVLIGFTACRMGSKACVGGQSASGVHEEKRPDDAPCGLHAITACHAWFFLHRSRLLRVGSIMATVRSVWTPEHARPAPRKPI